MGTGGMTVGDSEESVLGKRERGEQKGERAEKRKWAAEVLASSLGEDQSNREITTCHRSELLRGAWQERLKLSIRSNLQGPRPGRCWKGLQWDRSSFFLAWAGSGVIFQDMWEEGWGVVNTDPARGLKLKDSAYRAVVSKTHCRTGARTAGHSTVLITIPRVRS